MDVPTIVYCGLKGNETPIGMTRLKPSEIGAASAIYGSTYILRMGLHYDRYVVSTNWPLFQAVPGVYTAAGLAAMMTNKGRASSVTGNLGESIAALVARRKLNATVVGDIIPIIAPNTAKAPDFIMQFRPMFPASFQAVTGVNPAIAFGKWPVESKGAGTNRQAKEQIRKGLQQLGSFWYERYPYEPDVCGYGVIICLVYRNQPRRLIRIHVIVPSNQAALRAKVNAFRQANDKPGFLQELRTPYSPVRGDIYALD
jgi:hypothetical protein